MLDVCVAHPSAPSRVRLAPVSALKYRENGKISAYEPLAKEAGSRFVAFAFESFGGLGSAAISFLRDLASYAKESFLSCDYVLSLSSLAVLLQKGNAEMLAQGVIVTRSDELARCIYMLYNRPLLRGREAQCGRAGGAAHTPSWRWDL